MRKSTRATLFLVAAAVGLMTFYLWQHFTSSQTSHFDGDEDVNAIADQIRQALTNNSNEFTWSGCQQNASVEKLSNFSSLPDNIKDFLYYKHCRSFPMLLDIPDKCGGAQDSAQVFLLLVIKSPPTNYDRREVLRKTWARERRYDGAWIRRVFILGTTGSGYPRKQLDRLLQYEQREYNDILQWDFSDTLYNLTLKQMLFLEWMERKCPNARFLLNGDDDVFANTDNMVKYLQGLKDNNGSRHLFSGHLIYNVGPIRYSWSKYYIPVQVEESDKYPPYCGGGGFLLSGYTAMVIKKMSHSIPFLPIDDVYMGMCLAKAGLGPESHMGVKTAGLHIPSKNLDESEPCFYKEILLVHRFTGGQMFLMWQRINDPELKCGVSEPKKQITSTL